MLRISWPFALFIASVIAVVSRNTRLLVPVVIVFAIWYYTQVGTGTGTRNGR